MDMNEATAKAIAAERSAAHMTIKELAEKSRVPERTLIRILKSERNINVIQVAQIASAVGVYPHEIIESAERFVERAERGPIDFETDQPAGERGVLLDDVAARERSNIEATLHTLETDPMSLAAYEDPHKHDPDPDNIA